MPQRNQANQQQRYSTTTKIFLGLTTTLATANFLIWYYGLCSSDEDNTALSNPVLALGTSLMCPLFAAASGMINRPPADTPNTHCIGTTDGVYHHPFNNNDMLLAHNPEDVAIASKQKNQIITSTFTEFEETLFHFQIMNHYYDRTRSIFDTLTAEEKMASCHAQDINGRTPLFLSLAIRAPSDIQQRFMTEKSVLMPDKNGVTPLQLATMGLMDLQSTQKLLSYMKDEDFIKAYEAINTSQNPLSKKSIKKHFKSYEINPKKASNHCADNINAGNEPLCIDKATEKSIALMDDPLDLGIGKHGPRERTCFLATKKNVEFFSKKEMNPSDSIQTEVKNLHHKISDKSIADVVYEQHHVNSAHIKKEYDRIKAQKPDIKPVKNKKNKL